MSDGRPETVCCQPVSEAYADSLIGCYVQIFSRASLKDSFFIFFAYTTEEHPPSKPMPCSSGGQGASGLVRSYSP